MKRLIRTITASSNVDKPYDEKTWYDRVNEITTTVEDAYWDDRLNKKQYFNILRRLEDMTPYRPFENLSDVNRQKASDKLDKLDREIRSYLEE